MTSLLRISIISLIIGIIFWILNKRSFYTGIFLATSIGCILIFLLNYSYEKSIIVENISLIIFYGFIPLSLIAAGFLLIFNGKILKSKEGNRFANKLSIFLGIYTLLLITLIIYYLTFGYNLSFIPKSILLEFIFNGIYFGLLFLIYISYSFLYQKLPLKLSIDYIIVLGSGLIGDKVPPLLQSRLDKAIEIYNTKLLENNKIKIIVSGGKGSDELISEAAAMKKYLLTKDIYDDAIIVEDKSVNTYENLLFSKQIIDQIENTSKYHCVIVTNNFHVFRASVYSRKAKLKAQGIGAPTAFYYLPNALIREFIAILIMYKWLNIFVILFFLSLPIISLLPI